MSFWMCFVQGIIKDFFFTVFHCCTLCTGILVTSLNRGAPKLFGFGLLAVLSGDIRSLLKATLKFAHIYWTLSDIYSRSLLYCLSWDGYLLYCVWALWSFTVYKLTDKSVWIDCWLTNVQENSRPWGPSSSFPKRVLPGVLRHCDRPAMLRRSHRTMTIR